MSTDPTEGTGAPAEGTRAPADLPKRPDPRNMPRKAVLVARPVGVDAPAKTDGPDGDAPVARP